MKKYLYSLLMIAFMFSGLSATTYHVKTTGNNNNAGTEVSPWVHPWRARQTMVPGDSLVIWPGSYDTVQFIPPTGGNGKNIVIVGATVWQGTGMGSKYTTTLLGSRVQALTWTSIGSNLWTTTFNSPAPGTQNVAEGREYVAIFRDNITCGPRNTVGGANEHNEFNYNTGTNVFTLYTTTNPNSSTWRVAWRSIVYAGDGRVGITLVGLTIEQACGKLIAMGNDVTSLPKTDSLVAIHCRIGKLENLEDLNNPALIYHGQADATATAAGWSQYYYVNACSLYSVRPVGEESNIHAGDGIHLYFTRDCVFDSNWFDGLSMAIGLKMGCYSDLGVKALNWKIRYNHFVNIRDETIWVGNKVGNLEIYGNTFENCNMGVEMHSSNPCGLDPLQGNIKIKNNTFINVTEALTVSSAMAIGGNVFQYNLIFDTTSSAYGNANYDYILGFRLRGGENPLETPASETYWTTINNNMYYLQNRTFNGAFSSNSGFTPAGTVDVTWAQWTAHFDGASVTGANPNFAASHNHDFSRPTSTNEFSTTYDGKTWTRYGAWQPTGSGCATDVPVLSTPLNGSANLANPVVFDWADVAGATSYTIHVATDAAFNNIVVNQSPATSTYTSSVFADGTTYYWRVLATSSCGVSAWASYRIFTMVCSTTPSMTLSSPADLATSQPLSVTLDWADAAASLYQVQLSLAPAFTTNIVDQTTASSTYNVSSLGYATTYYWRVRGQNACGWGGWSGWSFSTMTAPTSGNETVIGTITSVTDDATKVVNTFDNAATIYLGNAGPEVCSTWTIFTLDLAQGVPCTSAFVKFMSRATLSGTECKIRIRAELSGNPATLTSASMAARTYTTAYVDWTIPAWTTDIEYQTPDLKTLVDEVTNSYSVSRICFKFADNLSNGDALRSALSRDQSSTDAAELTVNYPPANSAPSIPVLSAPTGNGNSNSLTPNLIINNSTDVNGDVIQYIFEISADLNFDTILVQSPFVAEGVSTTSWTSTVSLTNGVIYYWRARAYDGTVYTEWSSGNKFIIATTRLMDINQAWRDGSNGVIGASNGFQIGDVVRLTSDIITADNWGIIIQLKNVVLNGDGYTIRCNNITVPAITNPSFETGTGTLADGWDFTYAPNAQRLAGQYDEIAEYSNPSTLMTGDYSLRFQVPMADQVVLSSSTYTLDANRNWAIVAAYYNQIQNPTLDPGTDLIRPTIGFVTTGGDTLFSSEYLRGMMYRGPEPMVVHFKTTTSITGKIFIRIRGANTVTSTNSYLWVDDVKIIPYAPFSIGVAIDTTEQRGIAQAAVRAWNSTTSLMEILPGPSRLFSGLPTSWVDNVSSGDDVTIRNVVLRNNSAGGYGAYGLFIGYRGVRCSIYNSDILTIGPDCWNIFSGSAYYDKVYYSTLDAQAPYCGGREGAPTGNIDFNGGKGSGARGSIIYGNTLRNSIWCSILVQNRCDTQIDGIDTYPVPIVRKNTFYCKTKITNGFVVDFTGTGGFTFDSNFVYASGLVYHGTGVHAQYQSSTCEQWINIRDNYIDVSPDTVNQEYTYGTLAYGIQLEQAPRCSVSSNYVVAITDHLNDPSASALRINDGGSGIKQIITGNTFVALSNNINNSASACLQFGSPEEWDYDGTVDDLEIGYNTFSTNSTWIRGFTKMRDWQPNNNVFLINDSLTLMPNFTAISSSTAASGLSTDIRFLNNRYNDNVASKNAFKNAYMRTDHGLTSAKVGSQWFYAHQVCVNVASLNTGLFLPGIEVIAYGNDDALQDVDTTDAYGKVYLLVREFMEQPLASTYNVNTDRTLYNPYTIVARTLNRALSETVVATIDTFTTINMNLDFNQYPEINSPPFFVINKPSTGKVLPPLFNADTMASFIVLDDFGISNIDVYLRGGTLNKNIYSTSYAIGSRPSTQEITFAYNTVYEDTLAQYLVFVAVDDSTATGADSVTISIPVATNITVTFSGKYITDTKLDVTSPTANLATLTSFRTSPTGSRGWLSFNLAGLKGDSLPSTVDIVSSTLRLYNSEKNGTGTIGIHDVFKNGVTDQTITYNRFDRVGLLEWGVVGGNNTGDYPTCGYNITDAGGCDRTASALSLVSPVLNTYNTWTIPDSTIQFMFDGAKPNNGWLFVATGTSNCVYYTVEGSSPPIGTITYQVPRPVVAGNTYAPVLASIGSKSVTEGQLLSFTTSATDADLTTPFMYIREDTKPTGAVLTDNSDGTATFSWTPTYTQSGVYSLIFIATDGELTDQETVQITVSEVGDRAPIITGITNRTINENALLSFSVTGSDADGDLIEITATGLPSGATFIYDSYAMSASFLWTPSYTQAGSYNVIFIVTELTSGTLSNSYPFVITVNNLNRAPVLSSIGNKSVNENALLTFNMTATDADNQTLTFTGTNLPAGANITNVSNGNAQFNWQPTSSQAGVYNATLNVSDGSDIDNETIQITVNDVAGTTTVTISGTDVEDAYLRPSQPNANYSNYTGGSHGMYVFLSGANTGRGILRFKNIATALPGNAIIVNAYIKFTIFQYNVPGTLYAARVYQPWVEGNSNGGTTAGVSYNHFDITGIKTWTLPGAKSTADPPSGQDNLTGTVGTHYDAVLTPSGFVTPTAVGVYNISLSPALVQGWRVGTIANNGVILYTAGDFAIYQSETATSTNRPELIIEYVTSLPGKPHRRFPLRGLNSGVLR